MEQNKAHTPWICKRKEAEQTRTRTHRTPFLTQNSDHILLQFRFQVVYGAIRRSRFAFGRIAATQARKNTANQLRDEPEQDIQQTVKENTQKKQKSLKRTSS